MSHILKCHDIVKTDFVRGENCYLYDSEGRRYVDFESGIWCTILGHNHPRITAAMKAQIDTLIHIGTRYPNAITEAAAVDVLGLVGLDDGQCVFLSSGSEAVEFGVQAARRVTEKPLLLTFSHSYLAAYGSAGRKSDGWHLFDWTACENVEPLNLLRTIPFDEIGAFVFEPGGSGSAFVRFPPAIIVDTIARQIKEAGGLIVVNEITTGMGRTGKWFGYQHYDLQPDIVAIGKGLGNGYPVSAVAIESSVAEKLIASGLRYAQSHQNDPLGCAVAREVIATLGEGGWIERGNAIGAMFLQGLQRLVDKHEIVKEARGRGLLLGLELHPDERLTVEAIYHKLVEDGFLVGYYSAGNMLRFDPAATIGEDDVTCLLESLDCILGDRG